ncbi:MAG: hypothetical protein ACLVL7_07975 [Anaerotruncus massiliensis (ex Togo et al. 2019)]
MATVEGDEGTEELLTDMVLVARAGARIAKGCAPRPQARTERGCL